MGELIPAGDGELYVEQAGVRYSTTSPRAGKRDLERGDQSLGKRAADLATAFRPRSAPRAFVIGAGLPRAIVVRSSGVAAHGDFPVSSRGSRPSS